MHIMRHAVRGALLAIIVSVSMSLIHGDAVQVHGLDSPFERKFGDVKFLDAYFGYPDSKIEVGAGDQNVPFTVVLANVGTQDITGIRGELGLPYQFSPAEGSGPMAYSDAETNSPAGQNFALVFYVNVADNAQLRQYPGSVLVDYSRLRESGTRTSIFDFEFKLPGDSIINMHAPDPFLTSLHTNNALIQISNDGTAPVSDVEVELQNTQTAISSTSTSVTNVENVVIFGSNWEVGHIEPGQSRILNLSIYVPESLKGESLRTPMSISYFNSQGQMNTVDRVVDFFVQGFIDLTIYDVKARIVGERQLITGEVINEGNEDAMFVFVTLSPMGGSNLQETRQFVDEVETDSPVPFNIPVQFDSAPQYGPHDIKITVRYKDNLRNEQFAIHETTVMVVDPAPASDDPDMLSLPVIAVIAAAAGGIIYASYRRRRSGQ